MLVHKFDTKKQADEAMAYLNKVHGLPINGNTTMFDERCYDYHPDGYYYKEFNAEWTSELGEPIEITLPNNE